MLGFRLAAELEDEAPGQAGHVAVDLGVEQVAEADEGAGEGHRDGQVVQQPHEIEIVLLPVVVREPPHPEDQGDGAAMAGEAALPRHEDLPEALPAAQVVVRLVEQAVPEAGAHDGADQQGIEQRVQQFRVDLLALEEPFEDEPAQDEAAHEQERVPAEFETSDMQDGRVDVPMDDKFTHKHHTFNCSL